MPDRGLLERSQLHSGTIAPHEDGRQWALSGVRMAQITFEVDREAALAYMPEDVSRPVPCYARILVIEAESSPVGAFRLAALFVGGRFQLLPRNALVDGVVDGPAAEVSSALGGQFRPGKVKLTRHDGHLSGEVGDTVSSLATIDLPSLAAVDPSMLRWDPWLVQGSLGAAPALFEVALRTRASEAFLSKGGRVVTPGDLPRAHTWRRLRNINPISACFLEGDADLVLPKVQPLPP